MIRNCLQIVLLGKHACRFVEVNGTYLWMHQQSPTLLCSHVLRSLHLFEITGSGLQCEIVSHRSGFTMLKEQKAQRRARQMETLPLLAIRLLIFISTSSLVSRIMRSFHFIRAKKKRKASYGRLSCDQSCFDSEKILLSFILLKIFFFKNILK